MEQMKTLQQHFEKESCLPSFRHCSAQREISGALCDCRKAPQVEGRWTSCKLGTVKC